MDTKGYYKKYNVSRVDGKEITGPTFVLEPDHDKYAIPALYAYIRALKGDNSDGKWDDLIKDLTSILEG